jgi:hypothetical protein
MERIVPVRIHVVVWLALLMLTGLNIGLAQLKLG